MNALCFHTRQQTIFIRRTISAVTLHSLCHTNVGWLKLNPTTDHVIITRQHCYQMRQHIYSSSISHDMSLTTAAQAAQQPLRQLKCCLLTIVIHNNLIQYNQTIMYITNIATKYQNYNILIDCLSTAQNTGETASRRQRWSLWRQTRNSTAAVALLTAVSTLTNLRLHHCCILSTRCHRSVPRSGQRSRWVDCEASETIS